MPQQPDSKTSKGQAFFFQLRHLMPWRVPPPPDGPVGGVSISSIVVSRSGDHRQTDSEGVCWWSGLYACCQSDAGVWMVGASSAGDM